MVGQMTATKPSRSDEVLEADEQERIANQIRAQFDSLTPKRPVKPNRSEPGPDSSAASTPFDHSVAFSQDIPEHLRLRSLQSHSHAIISEEGPRDVQDEFVETQYYKELTSIDKQHHMTGSGFIRVVREEDEELHENGYGLKLPGSPIEGGETKIPSYKSNPATNDWVPNIDEHQVFVSSKPNRSESS